MTGLTDDGHEGGPGLADDRDDRPVVIRSTPADDRPVLVTRPDPDPGPARAGVGRGGRRARMALLVAVVVAAAAVLGWLVIGGGDEQVAARPAPAAQPAGPAPLSLAVRVPDHVVAGTPATVTVTYQDGAGTYSGSQEDWGDGVGTSALKEGRCGETAAAAPASGSYEATHTWARPGSYQLTVGVTSYTCVNGSAVEEQALRTVTVTVAGS